MRLIIMKKSVKKVVIAVVSALAVFTVIGTSVAAANNFGKEKLNAVVESVAEDKKSVDLTITKNDDSSFVDSTDDMYIFSTHGYEENLPYYIGYSFEDNGTVKATVHFEDEEINGTTFKIYEDNACICHVDEVIYTAEEFEKLREIPEDEFWSDGLNILQKAEKAYGELAENQQASMINGDIVIVTWEYVPFSYDITVSLN